MPCGLGSCSHDDVSHHIAQLALRIVEQQHPGHSSVQHMSKNAAEPSADALPIIVAGG